MTTEEGNKLIAKFMGHPILEGEEYFKSVACPEHEKINMSKNNLRYHIYWDSLMPVVEKIENLKNGQWYVHIVGHNMVAIEDANEGIGLFDVHVNHIGCTGYGEHIHMTKIEAVWTAIIEFIEWYIKNK